MIEVENVTGDHLNFRWFFLIVVISTNKLERMLIVGIYRDQEYIFAHIPTIMNEL